MSASVDNTCSRAARARKPTRLTAGMQTERDTKAGAGGVHDGRVCKRSGRPQSPGQTVNETQKGSQMADTETQHNTGLADSIECVLPEQRKRETQPSTVSNRHTRLKQ